MKLSDLEIGGRYVAKVSGQIGVVRITSIDDVPGSRYTKRKTVIQAVNERTGRSITIRSPQRLRKAADGCEFCRQAFNRPADGLACPYCGKAWPAQEVQP